MRGGETLGMAGRARLRRRLTLAGFVGLVVAVGRVPAPVDAGVAVPGGYRVLSSETLDAGIEHSVLRRDGPAEEVHVARLAAGQGSRLRTVLAGDVLTGPAAALETTTSMCVRVRCVVGVNGDFADGDRQPVGAMVSRGELVRTPGIPHAYAAVTGDRASVSQDFGWAAELRVADGVVPIAAVNRPQTGDGPTLYTARWGPSTGTDASTTELLAELPPTATSALPAGRTAVRLVGLRPGGGPIAPGQVVVAARGAAVATLASLWQKQQASPLSAAVLGVSTGGARDTIGGSPQLLKNGQLSFPTGNDDSFTHNRHPRTLLGVTPGGETLLVTVDGRQPGHSAGLTLVEAAELLKGLGATEAVNLDGGGSTSFIAGSALRNRPSDPEGERRVVSALVVVPAGSEADAGFAPTPALSGPAPLPLDDPASRPPNLLGDLLPPVQKAFEELDPLVRPATDAVIGAVDKLLAAAHRTSASVR